MTKGICLQEKNYLVEMDALITTSGDGPLIEVDIDPNFLPELYRERGGHGCFVFDLKSVLDDMLERCKRTTFNTIVNIIEEQELAEILISYANKMKIHLDRQEKVLSRCKPASQKMIINLKNKRYQLNHMGGNGRLYNELRCAAELPSAIKGQGHQCARYNGYGVGLLFCRQHSQTEGAMDMPELEDAEL